MKRLGLILIALLLMSLTGKGQTTVTYMELNTGFSTGVVPLFPGMSYMYGGTTKYPSKIVLDYEGGIAFPSVITGKFAIGYAIDPLLDLSVGIRPWPSSTFLQLNICRPNKCTDIVLTAEGMSGRDLSFGQSAILTIGWRWNNSKFFKRAIQ